MLSADAKMGTSSYHCLIFLVFVISTVQAFQFKLYRDKNYRALIYEHSAETTECSDLPEYAQGYTGSVTLSDAIACVILYEGPRCTGYSYKVSGDMTSELQDLRRTVSSFHPCNDTLGGRHVKVDMFYGNEIVAEYNDVCQCIPLPTQVYTRLSRLSNNGNCVAVYSTDSCGGTKTELHGGISSLSENLVSLGHFVRSISACASQTSCERLDATIYKFVIHFDTPLTENSQEVAMGQSTKFYNNGSATLTQEYKIVKRVRETTKITMSKSIQKMSGHKIEGFVSVEVSMGMSVPIPDTTLALDVGASAGFALRAGFGEGTGEGKTESETYEHAEEKEFSATQSFQVPPCTEYEVASAIRMVENYPMTYEAYSRVSGTASGRRLTAQEIVDRVDGGLVLVEIADEYTAIFKATEKMVANRGVETVITAEGERIEGCVA